MKTGTTIITLDNGYHLWTNSQGHGDIHLLCLHGGPGGNHEYFENFAQKLAPLGVQVTMYDQLGSFYSDQPDYSLPENKQYLTTDYYLSEVEEVRQKLGLDHFYLIGQSWGGELVQLYALKYGQHLKGAIISSMIDNIQEYVEHVEACREDALPPSTVKYMHEVEAKGDWSDTRYQAAVDILNKSYAGRKPSGISHLISTAALTVYHEFQGDNEFVVTGKLKDFDIRDQIKNITMPTLLTFGEHETMPLKAAQRMAEDIPHARLVTTPNAGHHHMIDNPDIYFEHLRQFISDVEDGSFDA